MIHTRRELIEYIKRDAAAQPRKKIRPAFFGDYTWKFQIFMRKLDYYDTKRKNNAFFLPFYLYYRYRYSSLGLKLGFSIPYNIFSKGLCIVHRGTIVINSKCKIGENCRLHTCVNIGASKGSSAPVIGNNVYIGPGTKIVGGVTIADGVCLGAGTVVVKSITEENTTWAGVPSRKISDNSSHDMLSPRLFD